MKNFSYITNSHPSYIESLYKEYIVNPDSIDQEYRKFFDGFDFAIQNATSVNELQIASINNSSENNNMKELAVYQLIHAYRKKGHLVANTNPIRERKDRKANLELKFFGLSDSDLSTIFNAGVFIGLGPASLETILNKLRQFYTSKIGVEFTYLNTDAEYEWLLDAFENKMSESLDIETRRRILDKINQGVIFEKFLHTKYIGQKRFSLEGGETIIPALDALINQSAEDGVEEVVIGMAHRGRLNVLANILGKTYEQIFSEFEATATPDTTMGSGDVKYHMGYSSNLDTPSGKKINVKLSPNPSHLEAVDPLVIGFSRAKADVVYNSNFDKVLPVLIHGDASLAGQGIVYEVLQMSGLDGYYTGGTIHIVINNQIGFTTDFDDARSADYCTSIASMLQAPVIHVNGDDPEAMVKALQIAADYRQEFNSDVFIDMLCYRRHGHNEGDDPKYTQPKLYAIIDKHPNPREVYTKYLMENANIEAQELAKEMEGKFWSDLQNRLDEVKQNPLPYSYQQPELWWKQLRKSNPDDFHQSPNTSITVDNFKLYFDGIMKMPENFKPLRKIEKLIQDKIKLYSVEGKIDWATSELLAFASILAEGNIVRMSGQDVKRGTFSHRHAVIYDENTNEEYVRPNNIVEGQEKLKIYNSLLSEYAVLGFEYGYAMANPNALVIWEAQFGDFCNGAQIIIDQFIASGEQKWNRMNGLVMLLPHGYEGQGPEHSSARMERFLQLSAENNIVVTNITTSANLFHAFRRQIAWQFRKPLINFSPKANLRHSGTYSHISEFTEGGFKEVIDDISVDDASSIKKVLFCSGKIYFDLEEKKNKELIAHVAIIRLEQLYPLPTNQIEALYKKYHKATWFWVQEEPLNMGAASFLQMNLKNINYGVISRKASASTATGYAKVHAIEQAEIIDTAFNI
jgi:2-oxoglutarate dehydrogenase E1 component